MSNTHITKHYLCINSLSKKISSLFLFLTAFQVKCMQESNQECIKTLKNITEVVKKLNNITEVVEALIARGEKLLPESKLNIIVPTLILPELSLIQNIYKILSPFVWFWQIDQHKLWNKSILHMMNADCSIEMIIDILNTTFENITSSIIDSMLKTMKPQEIVSLTTSFLQLFLSCIRIVSTLTSVATAAELDYIIKPMSVQYKEICKIIPRQISELDQLDKSNEFYIFLHEVEKSCDTISPTSEVIMSELSTSIKIEPDTLIEQETTVEKEEEKLTETQAKINKNTMPMIEQETTVDKKLYII